MLSPTSSRRGVVAVVAASCTMFATLALATTAGARPTGCTPGVKTIGGSQARVFCGPAKATVHVGSKTIRFSGGECTKSGGGYVVNLGTFTTVSGSKLPYFGLLISKPKPGKYARQALSFRSAGKSSSVFANVVLKSLRGGTFAGNAFGGGHVTGSFSC
jgi:hypothetical protein